MHITDTFLFLLTQEILDYQTHDRYSYPVMLEANPLTWWKLHGHLFPTLSRLARRSLKTPVTSCPVERLFSVAVSQVKWTLIGGHPCLPTT